MMLLLTTMAFSAYKLVSSPQNQSVSYQGRETADKGYLRSVIINLHKIKSASYKTILVSSAPGDTVLTDSRVYQNYFREYKNSADTAVGASIIQYWQIDSSKVQCVYDGTTEAQLNWENRTIAVDSFQNYPYPIRLVPKPFYTAMLHLLTYALTTNDNIKLDVKDFGDSMLVRLHIDRIVQFVPKKHIPVSPHDQGFSKYEVWINKKTTLPYRLKVHTPFQVYIEEIRDSKVNTSLQQKIVASDFYPKDFAITKVDRKKPRPTTNLTGKIAADWILPDSDNKQVRFKDLKSKVLLIQFTGIGCGPCHHSLPFLKQLVKDYKGKDFELVGIETWSSTIPKMKRYKENNRLPFKFLKADSTIASNYQLGPVPAFFILDENRKITKVITGYGEGTTDKELRSLLDQLL